ncbi:MAG: bacteriohemerythrin [Methylomonas lenta]|nr:bacteriohemerythrin [Methylomonas lenta]
MNSIDIFPWNENFNTGVPQIDQQHRRLVELLNKLAGHVAYQSNLPAINNIIDQLADYAVYHFETEESIWHQYFPEDLLETQHKIVHRSFIETVVRLKSEQASKPPLELVEEILAFLARWLAAHILESDRHLAAIVLVMQSGMPLEQAKLHAKEQMSGANKLLIDIILSIYVSLSTNTLQLMRQLNQRQQDQAFLLKLSQAVEQSPSSIIITNLHAEIEFVNQAFEKVTGYSRSEVLGQNPRILQSGKTSKQTYLELWDTLLRGEIWKGELINKRKNGSEYIEWALISPVLQPDGNITHYLAIKEDITERKHIESRLIESESHLRAIIENEPECIKIVDAEGLLIEMNQAGLAMIQADDFAQVSGTLVLDLVVPEHRQAFADMHQQVLAGASVLLEFELIGLKGTRRWMETHAVPMTDASGNVCQLAITRDISQRKENENLLRIAATAFESQEGMMVTDGKTTILRVNKAFTKITGYTAEEVIGKTPKLLKSGRHPPVFYDELWDSINRTGEWDGEIWNRRKSGDDYPQHMMIKAVKDLDLKVTHYVCTLTDVTLRKAAADKIERLAFYDPLTGLPNRQLLHDRLKPALASSSRTGLHGALLFIDLDNFKALNDTLGHDMGDLLLQQVAERLLSCVREIDTVARLGGDEFVVMLEDLNADILVAIKQVELIGQKVIGVINQPFQLMIHNYISTPSIGIALFKGQEVSLDQLLKHADIAMYQAKSLGRNTLCFFDPQMQEKVSAKVSIQTDLRQALDQQQFEVYYQIQVDAADRVMGAEALIRWLHPVRGLISPNEFIPLAEEISIIQAIGHWVLEKACSQIQIWQQDPVTCDLTLSVNVSPKQFFQTDFVNQVQSLIHYYAINPRLLKLELTESILIKNVEDTIATMNQLGAMGVQFSLDDFGTGYSSLQYLKKLPLNQLKIDQSFVRDLAIDSGDQAIVRTIIAMAKSLGLNVIAEGVETLEQRQFLLGSDCTHFQGYLFSKPVPINQFEDLLKSMAGG